MAIGFLPLPLASSLVNKTLAAGAGSYTLTGTAASVLHNYIISAGTGAYTLTGTVATLRRNLPLVAGVGSYALAGASTSLLHKYVLPAAVGAYTLAGADATLTHLAGKTVVAGVGTYALSGSAATLLKTYIVPAGVGAYAFSGVAATLRHGYVVTVGAGSYTISGSAAALRKTWLLSGGAGSYVLSGSAATLTHGGVAGLSSSGVRRLRSAHDADDKEAYYREVRRREALQFQQIRLVELQQQQEIEAKRLADEALRKTAQVQTWVKGTLATPALDDRIAGLKGEPAALNSAIVNTRAEMARLDAIEMQEALAASMREDDETILILAASI